MFRILHPPDSSSSSTVEIKCIKIFFELYSHSGIKTFGVLQRAPEHAIFLPLSIHIIVERELLDHQSKNVSLVCGTDLIPNLDALRYNLTIKSLFTKSASFRHYIICLPHSPASYCIHRLQKHVVECLDNQVGCLPMNSPPLRFVYPILLF